MSVLAFKRREKKLERIYFIPFGVTVDSVVVALATWPDATPATNWTDYQFDDVEKLKAAREVDEEVFVIPGNTGYVKDRQPFVTGNSYGATTAKTNALVKQLEYGLLTIPVAGVAQAPRVRKENYLDGVMLKETYVVASGIVTERFQSAARLSITDFGDSGPETTKVQAKFTELESANNSFLPVG